VHPVINFPEQGTYRVTLQATDVRGCKNEVVKYVEVKNDFSIYFPNSFTPNFDGLNDVFKPVLSPYGIASDSYELTIFDRWGKEVFRTTDITAGWDGSFMNRGIEIMKQDNFNYQVRFKDQEGQTYQRQGTITLMH
jgi:gliding motility-associated-like protein